MKEARETRTGVREGRRERGKGGRIIYVRPQEPESRGFR